MGPGQRRSVLCVLAFCSVGAGCGSGDPDGLGPDASVEADGAYADAGGAIDAIADAAASDTTWTIFVYGHADHNLSTSFAYDMLEMSEALIDGNVNVVVMADWDSSQPGFASGTEWYHVEGNGSEPVLFATQVEQNLDDPGELALAVEYAFTQFPADRYGLVMWDHGGAWDGGFGHDSQNGTTVGAGMPVTSIAAGIATGLSSAGIESPLEFLSFDTCLMAGVEVLAEFKGIAKVYIGNAELDYGRGWDYTASLTFLSENPDASAVDFGAAEVSHWNAHHATATANDALLRAHVALDMSRLEPFLVAFANFAADWTNNTVEAGDDLGRAGYFSLPAYSSTFESGGMVPRLRDVGQFLEAMQETTALNVGSLATIALDAVDGMVIARSMGSLRGNTQRGLHMELPLAGAVNPGHLDKYQQLAPTWTADTYWDIVLQWLPTLSDSTGPVINRQILNDIDPDSNNLPAVVFDVPDADVAEASIILSYRNFGDPNTFIVLGVAAMAAIEPGISYRFEWDGAVIVESSSLRALSVFPWLSLGSDASGALRPPVLGTFGLLTESDGTEHRAVLIFQDGDSSIEAAVILDPEPIVLGLESLVKGDPGLGFRPQLLAYSFATGEVSYVSQPLLPIPPNGEFLLSRAPALANDYLLSTTAIDIWGNESDVDDLVQISTPIF